MREPGAAEVVALERVDQLVLAQHHPAGECGVAARQLRAKRDLGSAAHRIDDPERAAAALAGGQQPLERQLPADAPAAQVARPVEPAAGRGLLGHAAKPDDRAGLAALGPAQLQRRAGK